MPQVFDDIVIDAEFAGLIPPLSAEERQLVGVVCFYDVKRRVVVLPSGRAVTLPEWLRRRRHEKALPLSQE